ncbi:hypothetical protein OAQ53_00465 [Gammaproteobacteria bacterium]|nr:hypothetical protein [Gammaproteobacteria bacterium]|tara:strand:+ start:272 stop:541 length:270 start_codon:yes stop_codon:yes gene_type:complete
MMTKNKYLIYSFIFIASISLHSYADHHDHFSFEEEHIEDCQACEENVDIKVAATKNKSNFAKISPKTNLITRFVSSKNKSNLSRAPPIN